MNECVVVGCEQDGGVLVGKPTFWGAWEYWVCIDHKAEVDDGATIKDNPDGRTIVIDR